MVKLFCSRAIELPGLTVFEKAVIYKYSEDGYESLNEVLRTAKGNINSDFGAALTGSLSKLPDFQGLVYRGANLSPVELKRYVDAEKHDVPVIEYSFTSTTKSELIALAFGRSTYFIIFQKLVKKLRESLSLEKSKKCCFKVAQGLMSWKSVCMKVGRAL